VYVCLCNGYRDQEIREIAESGVRCAREAYFSLGNGPCCGTCLDFAQGIVDEVHGETAASVPGERPTERPGDETGDQALLMAAE